MPHYRCYYFDADDHIAAAEVVDCSAATLEEVAADELQRRDKCEAVEIWDGPRKLHRAERAATPQFSGD